MTVETLVASVKKLNAGKETMIEKMNGEPNGNGLEAVLKIITENAKSEK